MRRAHLANRKGARAAINKAPAAVTPCAHTARGYQQPGRRNGVADNPHKSGRLAFGGAGTGRPLRKQYAALPLSRSRSRMQGHWARARTGGHDHRPLVQPMEHPGRKPNRDDEQGHE